MRFCSFIFVLFFTVLSNAQTKKGYYITNSGQRVEGFFKEVDFLKTENPEFTTLPGGEYFKLLPAVVKEYGIDGDYKFESHAVKVDLSQSTSDNSLSTIKEPKWDKRDIFLNILVEGDATLYSVFVGETKYFYSIKSKNIAVKQLVYKRYIAGSVIRENSEYKQDLFVNVNCNETIKSFENLRYEKNSLQKVFDKFNKCDGKDSSISYDNIVEEESGIKYTMSAGLALNRFRLEADGFIDKDAHATGVIGAEAVVLTPYSNFGIFARLDYTHAKGEVRANVDYSNNIQNGATYDVDYISFLVGPRIYFSKSKTAKAFFADIGLGFVFGMGDIIKTTHVKVNNEYLPYQSWEYKANTNIFIGLGIGYNISKKFGVDVRYDTNRETVNNLAYFKYGKTAVALRYTLN